MARASAGNTKHLSSDKLRLQKLVDEKAIDLTMICRKLFFVDSLLHGCAKKDFNMLGLVGFRQVQSVPEHKTSFRLEL